MATAEAMVGAADITHAVDAEVVAGRLADLADVVTEAGVKDLAEGAEMLPALDDVRSINSMVGLMSMSDMDHGPELSRKADELQTISDVVDTLEMPILSTVLGNRGQRLQEISIDVILRAAAEHSMTALIDATGLKIAELGKNVVSH